MPRIWSERSLRNMQGVHPALIRVLERALQESPLDFIVICGLRTEEEQRALFDQGATPILDSRHLTGHAVDLLPIGPDGKGAFHWPLYDQLGPAMKAAARAEDVSINWGGDWASRDGPHFELDRDAYPEWGDWPDPSEIEAPRDEPMGAVASILKIIRSFLPW